MSGELNKLFRENLKKNNFVNYSVSHSHAEVCPICHGSGKITDSLTGYTPTNTEPNTRYCHGCGGKGWVSVQDR
jgi:DnaJ-class molecular chaperone